MQKPIVHQCTRCGATLTEEGPLEGYHVRKIKKAPKETDVVLYEGKTYSLIACGVVRDVIAKAESKASGPIRSLGRHLDVWEAQGDTTVSINFLRRHFGLPSPFVHTLVEKATLRSFIPAQYAHPEGEASPDDLPF